MTPHNVSRCAHQHARRSPWIIPLTLQSRDRGRPGRQPLHGRTSRPRGHPRPGSHALDVTWGPSAAQGCQAAASPPCPGRQALPGEGLWARERRARSPGPHPVQPVGEATSLSRLWHLRPRSMETPGAAFTPGWTRPPEPRPRPQGIRAGGQARLAGAPRAARKVGTVAGGDGDGIPAGSGRSERGALRRTRPTRRKPDRPGPRAVSADLWRPALYFQFSRTSIHRMECACPTGPECLAGSWQVSAGRAQGCWPCPESLSTTHRRGGQGTGRGPLPGHALGSSRWPRRSPLAVCGRAGGEVQAAGCSEGGGCASPAPRAPGAAGGRTPAKPELAAAWKLLGGVSGRSPTSRI